MTPWRWAALVPVVWIVLMLAVGRLLRGRGSVPVDHLNRPSTRYPRPTVVRQDDAQRARHDVGEGDWWHERASRGLARDDDGEPWAPFRVQ